MGEVEKSKTGRINSKYTLSFEMTNDEGLKTIELQSATLIIRDQSPEAASAHLVSIVNGILAPAVQQASAA